MKGHVDVSGRSLINVTIRPTTNGAATHDIEAWIDTGFTGDLVLPATLIESLKLRHSGTVKAILADGSEVTLKTYACLIEWFSETRSLEIVANDGDYPLLGIGLLAGHDLHISYQSGALSID